MSAAAESSVCMLLETFHPEIGGGETQGRLLAECLLEEGISVVVVTRRSVAGSPPWERLDGLPVHRVPPQGRGRLRKWGLLITVLPSLWRLRGTYDVLLICGYRILGVPAVLAGKTLGKPCVLKGDSSGEMSGEYFRAGLARWRLSPRSWPVRIFLAVRNRILRKADAFVVLSSAMMDELRVAGVPLERINRIPNCVDFERFRPVGEEKKIQLRGELGLPAEGRIVLYTGRLVSYKGLPLLLRVWREISPRHRQATLVLVGEGSADLHDCEADLRRYVADHGLEARVLFSGAVDAETVPCYLQAADLFVFPTEDEAFGISLIEAMACGLPAVTTAVGGLADIVADGTNGLVVEAGDFDQLASALERMLTDQVLAGSLGAVALATARDRFDRKPVALRYAELIRKCAGRHDAASRRVASRNEG